MSRADWGSLTTLALALLSELGPMTRSELCRELAVDRRTAASIVTRLTRPLRRPAGPRRVRVAAWREDAEGERRYLRAVYGLGNEPDAKKPSVAERRRASKQRYRRRVGARLVNSVFALPGARESLMVFDLGSRVQHAASGSVYVITGHVYLEASGRRAYVYAEAQRPQAEWVRDGEEMEDGRFVLLEGPYYVVGRWNPTTWSVSYPAPGNSALKHVFAQVGSLLAAERLAVTKNLERAAQMK